MIVKLFSSFLVAVILLTSLPAQVLSASNPAPAITGVDYPGQISYGDYASIKVYVKNNGGSAASQSIALSFSSVPADIIIDDSNLNAPKPTVYYPGYMAGGNYCKLSVALKYPLVEGNLTPWPAGEAGYLWISVKPSEPGDFQFYVKSVATGADRKCQAWAPVSGFPLDQQGEFRDAYTINVISESLSGRIISAQPSTSEATAGQNIAVTAQVQNTGTVAANFHIYTNANSIFGYESGTVPVNPGATGSINLQCKVPDGTNPNTYDIPIMFEMAKPGGSYENRTTWGNIRIKVVGPSSGIIGTTVYNRDNSTVTSVNLYIDGQFKSTKFEMKTGSSFSYDSFQVQGETNHEIKITWTDPDTAQEYSQNQTAYVESNQTKWVQFQLDQHLPPARKLADLTVSRLDITPFNSGCYKVGEKININPTVENTGLAAANNFRVNWYVDASQIYSWPGWSMAAGDRESAKGSFWIVTEGSHTIEVRVDPDDSVEEINENNNTMSKSICVTGTSESEPDLVITDVTWSPQSPADGDRVTFYYGIKNQGSANASDFGSALYINNQRIDISARGPMAAGQSQNRQFTYLWTATTGVHSVVVESDWGKEVAESQENNNNFSTTLSVSQEPQPSLLTASISASPNSGDISTQFTFTINVQGGTAPYEIHLQDSNDQDLSFSQNGSFSRYLFNVNFTNPGTYLVHGYVTDANGTNVETNEISIIVTPETQTSTELEYNSLPLINLQNLPFSENKFLIVRGDQYYTGGFSISLEGPSEQIVAGKTYTYTVVASKKGGQGPDGGAMEALLGNSEILILIDNKDLEINATGKVTGAETYFYTVNKFIINLVLPAETIALKVAKTLTTLVVDKSLKPFFTFETPVEMSDLSEYIAISIKPNEVTEMGTFAIDINVTFTKPGTYNFIFIPDLLGRYLRIPGGMTSTLKVLAAYTRPILYSIVVTDNSIPVVNKSELVNLYESYIKQRPSSITNNSVPTKKEVIQYMETYIKGSSISKPSAITSLTKSQLVNLYESYIKGQPSAFTDNHVPTKIEVVEFMERYIKGK